MSIQNNPKKFIMLIILSYIILFFIANQILTWTLYYNFEKTDIEITNSLAQKNLDTIAGNSENVFEFMKSLCKQIFIDRDIKNLMYNSSSIDISSANEILDKLGVIYSNAFSYVHSVYIYNRKTDYFYCTFPSLSDKTNDFFDREICDIVKNLKVKEFKPIPRIIKEESEYDNDFVISQVYTLILYDLDSERKIADSAVIININIEWITNILKSTKFEDNSASFILDSNGVIVGSSQEEDFLKNVSEEVYVENVLDSKQESGCFNSKLNNMDYLVTYTTSPTLIWKFVKITPYNLMFKQINVMRFTTFFISIIILIAAILITFLLSKNLYPPINKLFVKVELLETMRKNNYNSFRKKILRGIFTETPDINVLEKNFNEFDIKLKIQKDFMLILLEIDNFAAFCKTYKSTDRNLMLFTIEKIANEIASNYFINEVIETGDNNLTVIMNLDELPGVYPIEKVRVMLSEIIAAIKKHCTFSVSCIVGNRIHGIQNIGAEFNKIVEMSSYRLIYGHSSIIVVPELIVNTKTDELTYPVHKENLLFDSLMLGKIDKAISIYREMLSCTDRHSYNDLMAFFTRLSLSVNSLLVNLKSMINLNASFDFYSFNKIINKQETLEEINGIFESLFKEICDALAFDKDNKYQDLISTIADYINSHYHDPNLSLKIVAEYVDKSPVYLGRIFKKLTGKSVSDCINEIRLKKSMELLSKSNENIEEICNNVGISNVKYFYIFFKKYTGVTPNEYRTHKS